MNDNKRIEDMIDSRDLDDRLIDNEPFDWRQVARDRSVLVDDSDDYLFPYIRKVLKNPYAMIRDRPGSRVLQAALKSLSCLSFEPEREILGIFLNPEIPSAVNPDKFSEYWDSKEDRTYKWLHKQMMKKSGCDREKFYNKFKGLKTHSEECVKIPCGSHFCPYCHDALTYKRKMKLLSYVMDVHHTQFTFTLSEQVWNCVNWDNLGDLYIAAGDATKEAYMNVYGVQVGILANSHTFSSLTLDWHPHLDIFVSTKGIDKEGNFVPATRNGMDPEDVKAPHPKLIKEIRRLFTEKVLKKIPNAKPPKKISDGYFWVRQNMMKSCVKCGDSSRENYVSGGKFVCSQCGTESSEKRVMYRPLLKLDNAGKITSGILGDTMRYYRRLPLTDSDIIDVRGDYIVFTTQERRSQGMKPIKLSVGEFAQRLFSHLKPKNFESLRLYGLYGRNNKYHAKCASEHGFDILEDMDLSRDNLKKIAKIILGVIISMGKDIDTFPKNQKKEWYKNDSTYLARIGYIVTSSIGKLNGEGIVHGGQERVLRAVVHLLDLCINSPKVDTQVSNANQYIENDTDNKFYFSMYDLYAFLESDDLKGYVVDNWKRFKPLSSFLSLRYSSDLDEDRLVDVCTRYIKGIRDKAILRTYSGLQSPCKLSDDEPALWCGFYSYGGLVRESVTALAIFNRNGFKQSYHNLFDLLNYSSFAGAKKNALKTCRLDGFG